MEPTEPQNGGHQGLNLSELAAVVFTLQAQLKEEREARLKAEEKYEKELKARKTDIEALKTSNGQLKAQLKQEQEQRKAGDIAAGKLGLFIPWSVRKLLSIPFCLV